MEKEIPFESRRTEDLDPNLVAVYREAERRWNEKFAAGPNVFLTCTHRNGARQNQLYAQGRTTKGPIVTWAKAGQSPHNLLPSKAFDYAFINSKAKTLNWDRKYFIEFAYILIEVAKEMNVPITWGGDWNGDSFVDQKRTDLPHVQLKAWHKS